MNHVCCIGLNPSWKKMRFQLAVNKTFCLNPQLLTHRLLKQRQRTKINKTMLCAPLPPPHQFSTQNSQYQNWKANKYVILTVNELGSPVLESSARILKFYTPTDSEHKFNKTETENWLLIGYNRDRLDWEPVVIITTLCSSAIGKNLQFLYTHP